MSKSHFWTSIPTAKDVDSKVPTAVKSAARAFRIIEFFDEIRRAARANEIANRLDLPQSSTSVLLNSMVRQGYLDFDFATHTYLPTLRVAMLSGWLDNGHFRDGSMMGMLERLAEETGFAVSLSTRSDIHVRYLHAIQTRNAGGVHITLAVRRYAVWSSAGIALLSSMPESDIKALVRRTKAENDPFVETIDFASVMRMVDEAVEKGYFFSRGLVTPNSGSISLSLSPSIVGPARSIALSVAGDLEAISSAEDQIVAQMIEAVASLPPSG